MLQKVYDKCVNAAIQCIRTKLELLLEADDATKTGGTLGDDYRAYGLLLSACKLKGKGSRRHTLNSSKDDIKKVIN